MGGNTSRHDDMIDEMANRIGGFQLKEHVYKLSNNGVAEGGEADLISINPPGTTYRNQVAYAFEVKTTDKPKCRRKAMHQLERDVEYIHREFGIKRVFRFYVYGKTKTHIERVKGRI